MTRSLSPMTIFQARAIARSCWIESDSDPEVAEALFGGRYPGVDQRTVALDLFQHWIDRKIEDPSVVMDYEEAMVLGLESE